MTERHLHIVTHEIPWPADHGGLTDLLCKIRALHSEGIQLHLHCFTKANTPQPALERYCSTVQYYGRKKWLAGFSLWLPFIVRSRKSKELIINLQKDKYPILFEGIHCTYYLQHPSLEDRKRVVRLHNTESVYYRSLARQERHPLRKAYFLYESILLKRYEKSIANPTVFLAVSPADKERYEQDYGANHAHYLPVFLPYTMAAGKEGQGCFCLYHGNLSVCENDKAAIWLLKSVFNDLDIPLVIAGKAPSPRLQRLAKAHPHTCLVADPSSEEMRDLVSKAQVHILPSFNATGIKLKVLNAFFNGRHCLVNKAAMEGAGIAQYCHIAESAADCKKLLATLQQQPFTEQEIQERQGILQTLYNNEKNVKELLTFLY